LLQLRECFQSLAVRVPDLAAAVTYDRRQVAVTGVDGVNAPLLIGQYELDAGVNRGLVGVHDRSGCGREYLADALVSKARIMGFIAMRRPGMAQNPPANPGVERLNFSSNVWSESKYVSIGRTDKMSAWRYRREGSKQPATERM